MIEITVPRSDTGRTLVVAAIALLMGVAYYWLARIESSAAFLTLLPSPPLTLEPAFFARYLGWLPTFVHVLAFSLLTWLALGRRDGLLACTLWGVTNATFELGQALSVGLIQHLPEFLNLRDYLIHGVFDPFDLAACAIGAWVAWIMTQNSRRTIQNKGRTDQHSQKKQRYEVK